MSSPRAKASYHNVRIIVIITLAVTLCYPAVVNTAAVRSEKLLQGVLLRDSRNVKMPPSSQESDEEDAAKRYCSNHNTPCGWAVYDSYTRDIIYYMKNTCECLDESYKCVRERDDLSASAYVYRCRQNTTADDIPMSSDDSI
ncbi:uncharacterized protein LOC112456079 [Temnothorax curvispinosus]|uniref:Uncharacterized protein LOC112456079 n=1 Tax=Temnothorax curvispinosus TaxID=300111 RepID=A0A6J1PW74_9HYME|nr:uncharacterized protein LOC112456079 [Temnothorax curvispinosus]